MRIMTGKCNGIFQINSCSNTPNLIIKCAALEREVTHRSHGVYGLANEMTGEQVSLKKKEE